jgi:hypothetical protein
MNVHVSSPAALATTARAARGTARQPSDRKTRASRWRLHRPRPVIAKFKALRITETPSH